MERSYAAQQSTGIVGDRMIKQYIEILTDSLQKKEQILDRIIGINEQQTAIIKADTLDEEGFDKTVEEKDTLIAKLDDLDNGFERVFARVEEELSSEAGRKQYAAQIGIMKTLITSITGKSMTIQAGEEHNKKALERYFREERERIKSGRIGSKTALNYYNNMKNRNHVPPHFLDSKN